MTEWEECRKLKQESDEARDEYHALCRKNTYMLKKKLVWQYEAEQLAKQCDEVFNVCMESARRCTEANDAYRCVMDEAVRKEVERLKIKKCEKGSDGKVSIERGIAYVDRMYEVEDKILKEK